jgi:hypothetical protein
MGRRLKGRAQVRLFAAFFYCAFSGIRHDGVKLAVFGDHNGQALPTQNVLRKVKIDLLP